MIPNKDTSIGLVQRKPSLPRTLGKYCGRMGPCFLLSPASRRQMLTLYLSWLYFVILGISRHWADSPRPGRRHSSGANPVLSVGPTHPKSLMQLFLVPAQVTVPGHDPYLTKLTIPRKSQTFSALKKDFHLPLQGRLDSILVSEPSCPTIPLYKLRPNRSAATKPSLFLFFVILWHIFFK